ncbi:MAG: peptide deformylase [Deltaproteobacteria bacterium]|nr:peptide deformylase [Deltaproteobacteria bacterium]
MRTILKVPNPILRQKSKPIKEIGAEVKAIAADLIALLNVKREGTITCGLAAPQVGELIRMFVYRPNPHSDIPDSRVVINPEIIYAKGKLTGHETCLSVPGPGYRIKRHKIVKLRGLDLNGEQRTFKGRDLIAQVLEHERDHLDGILIDKIGIMAPH